MEWLLAAPQIQSVFSSLGFLEGNTYVVNSNALAILEEINYKLAYEDQTLRTFRRAIGFGQNVRSDLIPLLENAKDDLVLDAVIRILVNLTVPVECLFSVEVMYRTEVGRHTIFELNKLLYTSKEAFTDAKSTKSVVEYMKHILESDSKLSPQKCDKINNCLLLLRNILHIPEAYNGYIMSSIQTNSAHAVSMQNTILWNLFIQSIDKLLLYLMTSPQRAFWGVTMVQLIAIMYKDQHVSTLQKMLNMWFEASLSESSEDNESNTSPPKQGSGDSSPMLTSDPTSDSSDNGSGGSKNECAEDRRHVSLREETEATLQEVRRKGHEYQNSIFCTETEAKLLDNSFEMSSENNDIVVAEKPCTSNEAAAKRETAKVKTATTTTKTTATATTTFSPIVTIKTEVMQTVDEEEGVLSDATVIEPLTTTTHTTKKQKKKQNNKNDNKQPAEHKANTSNIKSNDGIVDVDNFKPPPPLPLIAIKATTTAPRIAKTERIQEAPTDDNELPTPKPQKVPHSGKLSFTNGKCCPQKRECPSSQSELSDCGYGTQVENQESISTSSNDDDGPQHQKPPCNSKPRNKQRAVLTMVDKKELRRKKLVKRSKSSLINMKGLVQHTPTDDDISNLLKEFTVDFLLKGYGNLVEELHSQLLTNMLPIDTSHFFWLVTYFLKFAAQLELDMEHIHSILTFDVISYLTYEGVTLCEQLELNSKQKGSDLKPYLRRMHLVVTAIREFLQAIDTYKKVTHLSEDDRKHLRLLQNQISSTEDLRNLFVLLLRRFNPSLHTKQYLQDLVVTNHILLLILDSETQSDSNISIKMIEHVSQFATLEVMHFYGLLLEDFNNNGEFINDCIFTMLHHVGGDLGQIGTLFQPIILKTFTRIWEADYELCDDWSDLIEYVIHKFINTPQKSSLTLPSTSLTKLTKEHNLENTVCTWTQEEMDTLYWYYVQSKKTNDTVGKIIELFTNNGNKQKSRISIIQQLLQQDIITLVEYDDLMKFEDAEYQRSLMKTPTSSNAESGIEIKQTIGKPTDDIQILRDLIIKENKEKHLIWLQKLLLECCYIKMVLKQNNLREHHKNLPYIMEPVAYHCILKNKSIPVVQWNNEQTTTMLYQPFVLLLHKLGFQLPADAGSIFARIPDYWSVETMYGLAKKLGPLDELLIKIDANNLEDVAEKGQTRLQHMRGMLSLDSNFDTIAENEELIITKPTTIINNNNNGNKTGIATTTITTTTTKTTITPTTTIASATATGAINATVTANANEIFAVPKVKHCNSIIRFTPDPEPTPSVPNWLQLVMRSKLNTNLGSEQTRVQNENSNSNSSDDSDVRMSYGSTNVLTSLAAAAAATSASSSLFALSQLLTTATTTATTTQTTATTTPTAAQLMSTAAAAVVADYEMQRTKIVAAATTTLPCESINNIISDSGNSSSYSLSNSNSQCNNDKCNNESQRKTAAAAAVSLHEQQQTLHNRFEQIRQQNRCTDNDSAMKTLERNDSTSSGYFTRSGSSCFDNEYSAMVVSAYEHEIANSDSASVASDLTRMYVSDEDERH